MPTLQNDRHEKWLARSAARRRRKMLFDDIAAERLISHFPDDFSQSIIAGFAPIGDEINLWPLLQHLRDANRIIGLPVTEEKPAPLTFRQWTENCEMACDKYGIQYPKNGAVITPTLILLPLLAFTPRGDRLGYGGGYYDRTLANLRAKTRAEGEIFACGVAYAGQEVDTLPTDDHDERLDGILTEDGFRRFT